MCDESTDISNVEQGVICLRTVNNKFKIREDFQVKYFHLYGSRDFLNGIVGIQEHSSSFKVCYLHLKKSIYVVFIY